jgi:Cytochrome c
MHARKLFGIAAVLVALAVFAMAQQPAPTQEKVIKHVPVKPTSAASGQEMFTTYCAVCHGGDGMGSGPAASALKVPLTRPHSPRSEERRNLPRVACFQRAPRRCGFARARQQRHAGLGSTVSQPESGS